MTPEQLEVLKVLGLSAVFLFQLNRVYNDAQKQHAETMGELKAIREDQQSIKSRLTRLETEFNIYDPPTKPQRPVGFPAEQA